MEGVSQHYLWFGIVCQDLVWQCLYHAGGGGHRRFLRGVLLKYLVCERSSTFPTPTWSSSEVATLGQWEVYLGGRSPTLVSVNVVFSSSSKEGMYVNSRRGFSAFLTLPWACPWPNRLITWGLLFEESPNPPFSVSFSFPHFSLCLFRSFANQDFSALFLFSFHS